MLKLILKHSVLHYFGYFVFDICLIVLFSIGLYITIRRSKSIIDKSEKDIWLVSISSIVLVPLILILTLLSVIRIFECFYTLTHKVSAAATLTAGLVAALSLLGTLFGILYTNAQNRIQAIHAESSWRKTALKLEQQPLYQIKDLISLNSLFNAYKPKLKDDIFPVDFYINKVIITILNQHEINTFSLKEFKEMRENIVYSASKIKNNSKYIPFMYRNSLTDNFETPDDLNNSNVTLFNYDINEKNMNDPFKPEENQVVRKCIHALLKNDWDNITK